MDGDKERIGSDTIEMVDQSTPTKDKVKGKIESLSSSQSEKQKKLELSLVPFGSSWLYLSVKSCFLGFFLWFPLQEEVRIVVYVFCEPLG